jgi:hypothetical protein
MLSVKFNCSEFWTRRFELQIMLFNLVICETVGLERVPLNLVRINDEQLKRKLAAQIYKTEINGCWDPSR